MRLMLSIALTLLLLTGLPFQSASAEPTDENRSVAESLTDEGPVDEAEEGNQETPVMSEEEPLGAADEPEVFAQQNTFLIFAQMIAALAFVIFLIYFLLRFLTKRSQSYRSTQMLQNIGGVPLGANRSVQLLKVGDRLLVVGVGETIQLLKEIDQKAEIDRLLMQQQEQLEKFDQPINKLLSLLRSASKKSQSVPLESNNNAFKELLAKQLKGVSDSQHKLHDAVRERDK